MTGVVYLTLTQTEALMIGLMLDEAMNQYNASTPDEQADDAAKLMVQMCKRVRPYLPFIPDDEKS